MGSISQRPRKAINLDAIGKFERMKTVFCHVDHTTDEVSSVFNVKFD